MTPISLRNEVQLLHPTLSPPLAKLVVWSLSLTITLTTTLALVLVSARPLTLVRRLILPKTLSMVMPLAAALAAYPAMTLLLT